jgi:osmotically-inducible protein OsmY
MVIMALRALSILLVFALVFPVFAQTSTNDNKNTNDDKIYDSVRQKLANDPDVKGADLEVAVKNGVVTMKGTVGDEHAREKAEKIVKKVKGVTRVENQLKVFGS